MRSVLCVCVWYRYKSHQLRASHIKTKSKTIQECVDIIKESGGIAIIAHPWTLGLTIDQLKKFILEYKLDGIEVYNHNISNKDYEELNKLADVLSVYKTCGTDYHGKEQFDDLLVKQEVDCSKILRKIIGGRF